MSEKIGNLAISRNYLKFQLEILNRKIQNLKLKFHWMDLTAEKKWQRKVSMNLKKNKWKYGI